MTAIKTPTLDNVIQRFRRFSLQAATSQSWQAALSSIFEGITWRSVRLAIQLNILPLSFEPQVSWKLNAILLQSICFYALNTQDREEPDYRVEVIGDVLTALMNVAATIESTEGKTADGLMRFAIEAANLGRCEVMLGFAEDGFWEQVYEWRRRQGGKPKGKGLARWKELATPEVKRWVEEALSADGDVKIVDLENKLLNWLDLRNESRSRDAVKAAIRQMRTSGVIPLPIKSNSRRNIGG